MAKYGSLCKKIINSKRLFRARQAPAVRHRRISAGRAYGIRKIRRVRYYQVILLLMIRLLQRALLYPNFFWPRTVSRVVSGLSNRARIDINGSNGSIRRTFLCHHQRQNARPGPHIQHRAGIRRINEAAQNQTVGRDLHGALVVGDKKLLTLKPFGLLRKLTHQKVW